MFEDLNLYMTLYFCKYAAAKLWIGWRVCRHKASCLWRLQSSGGA